MQTKCRKCSRVINKGEDVGQVESTSGSTSTQNSVRTPPPGTTIVGWECYPNCTNPTGAKQWTETVRAKRS